MESRSKWAVIGLVVTLVAGFAVVPLVVVMATAALFVPTAVNRCQVAGVDANGVGVGGVGYTVMSYNIKHAHVTAADAGMEDHEDDFAWSKRGPVVVQYIKNVSPDLLGLQEAGRIRGTSTRQVKSIISGTSGYTWVYKDTADPIAFRTSAFTLVDKGRIRLNYRSESGATLDRIANWVKLRAADGTEVFFVNLHAQFGQLKAQAKARSVGWGRLVKALEKINPDNAEPIILAGDFNANSSETRAVYRDHRVKLGAAGFVDAATTGTTIAPVSRATSYNGWGDTIGGKWYYKAINRNSTGNHIDYVWTAGEARATTWQVYTGPAATWKTVKGDSVPFASFIPSDHWPVIATVAVGSAAVTDASALSANTGSSTTSVQVSGYSSSQLAIAGQIVAAGQSLGLDTWSITVGVMTGIGESSLRNLGYGDAVGPDSRGVFQQRSSGWGTLEERMDPHKAALSFFKALVKVAGYRSLAPTIAAHRTQRNADPNHYAKYWDDAVEIVAKITNDSSLVSAATGGTAADCDAGYSLGDLPAFSGDCPASGSAAENGLQPTALLLLRCVKAAFPQITSMGGRRSSSSSTCSFSDHCAGLAVDFMIPSWRTTEGNALGWQIAHWVQENAAELNVSYIIWDAKKWNPAAGDSWRAYTHPYGNSSPTLAHLDHVHVSVNSA